MWKCKRYDTHLIHKAKETQMKRWCWWLVLLLLLWNLISENHKIIMLINYVKKIAVPTRWHRFSQCSAVGQFYFVHFIFTSSYFNASRDLRLPFVALFTWDCFLLLQMILRFHSLFGHKTFCRQTFTTIFFFVYQPFNRFSLTMASFSCTDTCCFCTNPADLVLLLWLLTSLAQWKKGIKVAS